VTALLRVSELRLSRGTREVLRGVSLDANRGEVVALMGLSGGGKTTVLRSIAALEPFDGGSIDVDGVTLRPGPLPPRATLAELVSAARPAPPRRADVIWERARP